MWPSEHDSEEQWRLRAPKVGYIVPLRTLFAPPPLVLRDEKGLSVSALSTAHLMDKSVRTGQSASQIW